MNENSKHTIVNLHEPLDKAAHARLEALEDRALDYSDVPPLPEAWLREAAKRPRPTGKKPVSIRLDADIIDFFKQEDAHYQSRINAVLRCYVDSMRV